MTHPIEILQVLLGGPFVNAFFVIELEIATSQGSTWLGGAFGCISYIYIYIYIHLAKSLTLTRQAKSEWLHFMRIRIMSAAGQSDG